MAKNKASLTRLRILLREFAVPNFFLRVSSMLQNTRVHGVVCPEVAIKPVFLITGFMFAILSVGRLPLAYADAPNTFTYQGRLKVSNSPVNGNASIAVQFCTAPSGGTCYPAADNTQTVAVSSGLFRAVFNLPTDAGFNLATGPWYLQIYETASGSALSNPLSPREQFTSSPYAMYTTSATYANGLNAASGASIIPVSANLTLANNAAIAMSGTAGTIVTGSSVTASAFFGNGAGLSNVTASAIPGGSNGQLQFNNAGATGGAASLSYNSATGNLTLISTATIQGNAFSVGGSTLVVTNGNVGIGSASPLTQLDVNGIASFQDGGVRTFPGGITTEVNAQLIEFGMNESLSNRFGGAYTSANQGGFLRVDPRAGGNLFSFWGRPAGSTSFVNSLMVLASNGNLGVGTTSPSTRLHVSGGDLQVGDASASTMSAGGYVTMANLSAAPVAAKGRIYFDPTGLGALKISLDGSSFVPLSTGSAGGGISSVVSNPSQFSGTGVTGNALTLLSSSVTLQGNTFNGPNQLVQLNGNGGLILAGSSITLSGANGYITSGSSIIASAFYGNGSNLTGISGSISGGVPNFVSKYTGATTLGTSSLYDNGTGVTVTGNSTMSVTGTAFSVGGSTLAVIGGSVGIGSGNPSGRLSVQGQGNAYSMFVSTDINGGYPNLVVSNAGRVGLGISNPSSVLHVVFPWGITSPLSIQQNISGSIANVLSMDIQGALSYNPPTGFGGTAVDFGGNSATSSGDFFRINPANSTTPNAILNVMWANSGLMIVKPSGSVGIGTTSPQTMLDVNGNVQFGFGINKSTFTTNPGGSNYALQLSSGISISNGGPMALTSGGFIQFGDGTIQKTAPPASGSPGGVTGQLQFNNAGSFGGSNISYNNGNGSLTVPSTVTIQGSAFSVGGSTLVIVGGAVGIGVSNPTQNYPLDVNGIIRSLAGTITGGGDALAFTALGGGTNIRFGSNTGVDQLYTTGASLALMPGGSGNVGIGTTTPAALLDVAGNAQFGSGATKSTFTTSGALFIASGSSITLSGTGGYIASNSSVTASAFFGDGSHLSGVLTSTGFVASTNTWSAQQNYLNQITISSNLIMNSGGSIGIGTSNPAYKLDVQGVGQINAAGGLCINGQCQSAWAGGFTPWTAIGTIVQPTISGNNVLVQSTLTVQGNAFSVGGSTLVVTSGNVGIAAGVPQGLFDVGGGTLIVKNGSVGISTTTPAAPLHVIGNVLIGGGGHLTFGGPLPTLSGGCGTTPTVQGNDVAGIVTIGGAPTSTCTLTFANAWPRNPACVAMDVGSAGPNITFLGIATSSVTFNFSAAPSSGLQVSYNCLGF